MTVVAAAIPLAPFPAPVVWMCGVLTVVLGEQMVFRSANRAVLRLKCSLGQPCPGTVADAEREGFPATTVAQHLLEIGRADCEEGADDPDVSR
jgi:hypothetical protein